MHHLTSVQVPCRICVKCIKVTSLLFLQPVVSCGHPFPPANGTIELYSSTQEGAEVQYHCDEGHTPREWRTSHCQENGTWAPDPALLDCTFGKFCKEF